MYEGIEYIPSITATNDTVTCLEGQVFYMLENKLQVLVNFDSFATRGGNKFCTDTIFAGFDLTDEGHC